MDALQTLPFSPMWLVLLALWTLPWKGIALWRAARLKDQKWFLIILIVNTLAILDIIYIYVICRKKYEKLLQDEKPPVV
jgi:hypothetical protein